MSNPAMTRRKTSPLLMFLVLLGCTTSSPSVVPAPKDDQSTGFESVTIYVAGMNQKLQILWGDWPNKVKKALEGLKGVELVEDEWQREIESDEDLDLLFVTFNPEQVTIEKLLMAIAEHGFKAKVKP
jgi:copper chaperone CopZ